MGRSSLARRGRGGSPAMGKVRVRTKGERKRVKRGESVLVSLEHKKRKRKSERKDDASQTHLLPTP